MNDLPAGILKSLRTRSNLSAEEVVEKLNRRGIEISVKTLYGYESGVSTPRVNTFIALCDIYQVDDIMSEFGYGAKVKLATGESEWHIDMYNDFFNASLLEKIYILLKEGVPSFAGYEQRLEASLPKSSEMANFNKLYNFFMQLNEPGQGAAMYEMMRIASDAQFLKNPQSTQVG